MAHDNDIELSPEEPKKKGKFKLIAIGLAGMLVVVGATVGGLFAAGLLKMADPATADAEASLEPVKAEAVYIPLEPAFTVNFADPGDTRFLQLSIEAMARDPGVESSINQHMPMIRNDLMLLFSSKNPAELGTRDGKQALQAETLASIRGALERAGGAGAVEAVYFTSFVMQ